MDKKRSFVFYTDYREQLSLLDDAERGCLLLCLIDYADHGTLPSNLSAAGMMCFVFIRQRMDRDTDEYERICRVRAAAGAKGGRPKKEETTQTKDKQDEAKKANGFYAKQNNPDNDLELDPDLDLKENTLKGVKEKHFVPPTSEDVRKYCQEHGYSIDSDYFVDFYTAKDWMIGKNKMKDWKAAVRNWARTQRQELTANGSRRQESTAKSKNRFHNLEEHGYDYDKIVWEMMNGENKGDSKAGDC